MADGQEKLLGMENTVQVFPGPFAEIHRRHEELNDAVAAQGRKDDSGKLRYDLLPMHAEKLLATVLSHGAEKYTPRNWEQGIAWSRVYAALRRHLAAWWQGEDVDADSKLPTIGHVLCCVVFLAEYITTHPEMDDRPYAKK